MDGHDIVHLSGTFNGFCTMCCDIVVAYCGCAAKVCCIFLREVRTTWIQLSVEKISRTND